MHLAHFSRTGAPQDDDVSTIIPFLSSNGMSESLIDFNEPQQYLDRPESR